MIINQIYKLKNAILCNATLEKEDVIAMPINSGEIRKYQGQFNFNFLSLSKDYIVYKLYIVNRPDIIHGLVAFQPRRGVLECINMETNNFNKRGYPLYGGIGKCMVALCCKISMDTGCDGFIAFDSKTTLMPYYKRLGARQMGNSIRMFIEPTAARKLIDKYF